MHTPGSATRQGYMDCLSVFQIIVLVLELLLFILAHSHCSHWHSFQLQKTAVFSEKAVKS